MRCMLTHFSYTGATLHGLDAPANEGFPLIIIFFVIFSTTLGRWVKGLSQPLNLV